MIRGNGQAAEFTNEQFVCRPFEGPFFLTFPEEKGRFYGNNIQTNGCPVDIVNASV